MEHLGAISELDWNAVDESELMMAQLLGDPSTGIESMFRSDHDTSMYWSGEFNTCILSDPNTVSYYCTNPSDSVAVAEHVPPPKRKSAEDEIMTESPKKVGKSAGNARPRRKSARSEAKEESNGSYSSEDNSNACREVIFDDTKGKTRASRGSATDPQSLYARKRRERINERLKILQNLVPNGTKVDISTMLEEAVQYVKFLQLQIKLLSSDDTWMYAPLAYNGMDIGLDIKIPFPDQTNNSSTQIHDIAST